MAVPGKKRQATGTRKKKTAATRQPDLESVDDDELRRWATEMRRRREELADPKRRPYVVSRFVEDGSNRFVARKKSEPTPVKKLLRPVKPTRTLQTNQDIKLVREAWERAVGPAIASETRVYSFKKGVLTIAVASPTLLQEIRQFHSHPIFADLSDLWTLTQPLIKVTYRLGQ